MTDVEIERRIANIAAQIPPYALAAFSGLDVPKEERASLARTLAPIASQRAIADMVGVDKRTIAEDLGKSRGAKAPVAQQEPLDIEPEEVTSGANAPPPLSGLDAAKLARKAEERQQRASEQETRDVKLAKIEQEAVSPPKDA